MSNDDELRLTERRLGGTLQDRLNRTGVQRAAAAVDKALATGDILDRNRAEALIMRLDERDCGPERGSLFTRLSRTRHPVQK